MIIVAIILCEYALMLLEDPWAEQARAWEEQRACDRYDRECNPDMWYGDDPSRKPYRRGW